ncbi:MAG TPA: hypothetical protein DDY16_06470 [Tenacibaculum sp.]|nr:hypothetical protein [Tenacibaculum sp.]
MFTPGRIIFASLFLIVFVTAMVLSYRKDAKRNKKHYQNGALYTAMGILVTLLFLFLFKYISKN